VRTVQRFWNKVDKRSPDDCWIWTGSLGNKGYGRIRVKNRTRRAHRISWMLAHKTKIPKNKMICHTCDNRACVNPAHLYLGDNTTNMRDKSSLTPREVKQIRHLYKLGGYTYADLGWKFGVALPTIGDICRHSTWKEI